MKELNYKQMVEEISALTETEFVFDMDCKNLPHSIPITQEEAMQMVDILGRVYKVAHAIHCGACRTDYIK